MKISILTLFPEMFDGFLNTSIIKKARLKELVEIECIDIRSFSTNKHKRVDDYPFGGGQGLVMAVQPVVDALKSVKTDDSFVLLSSPRGQVFNQAKARSLSQKDHIVFICGHYEGLDERITHYVDEEISIGDFILTGGELASMVVTDGSFVCWMVSFVKVHTKMKVLNKPVWNTLNTHVQKRLKECVYQMCSYRDIIRTLKLIV